MIAKKSVLIILDWFGINNNKIANPLFHAKTPYFDELFNSSFSVLEASGKQVWLPEWQMWNSEVGHMTIWTWRVIKQNLLKINDMLDDGSISGSDEFLSSIAYARQNNNIIHILTLFWEGWVHSHLTHLCKFINIIPEDIKIKLHLFWDWRDLPPMQLKQDLSDFIDFLKEYSNVSIVSLSWRYFAMDRDNNWDRIQKAYNTLAFGENFKDTNIISYIEDFYSKNIGDEFIEPVCFRQGWINSKDVLFFLNFRSDRAHQLIKAFYEKEFKEFPVKKFEDLKIVSLVKTYKEYLWDFFVADEKITNCLAEVLSNHWKTQLHLAETEKFAHVTKFFNGWKQVVYPLEEDILINSPKVETYDLKPEMSAFEIKNKYLEFIDNHDFVVINFANPDMVWHTWNFEATIKALETLDSILKEIIDSLKKYDISIFVTADHWNSELMLDENSKTVTSHSINPVPFWIIKNWEVITPKINSWTLSDISPTILYSMWIEIPEEMTWKILI